MSLLSVGDADFDSRWAAWQERGRVQDRLTRARLRIVLPAAVVMLAIASYLLLTR